MLVGESSAWGIDAGLGPVCSTPFTEVRAGCYHRWATKAYHLGRIGPISFSPAETNDPEIINGVLAVANNLARGQSTTATAAAVHPTARIPRPIATAFAIATKVRRSLAARKKGHAKSTTSVVSMASVGGGVATAPQAVRVSNQGFVVATHPFLASCNGKSWAAQVIVPGVWGVFGVTVPCAIVAHIPPRVGYMGAAPAPHALRVTATTSGSSTAVRVFGLRGLSATLSRPGQRQVRLHEGRGDWQVVVPGHGGSAIITVVSGHRVFTGTLNA